MTGIELIAKERREQIEKHGWSSEHASGHKHGELAKVAAKLTVMHTDAEVIYIGGEKITWGLEEKLKDDPIHALKVAGALIAAEIDRLNALDNSEDDQVEFEDSEEARLAVEGDKINTYDNLRDKTEQIIEEYEGNPIGMHIEIGKLTIKMLHLQ